MTDMVILVFLYVNISIEFNSSFINRYTARIIHTLFWYFPILWSYLNIRVFSFVVYIHINTDSN